MSAHRLRLDGSLAPFMVQDSGLANITAGGGILQDFTEDSVYFLQSTAGSTEVRTLKDPVAAGIYVIFTLVVRTSNNLTIQSSTPLWVGASVTQPAITQLGQLITFTARHQVAGLYSVPCAKVSFTGTQTTFTNVNGFRWSVDICDGPTVT